MKMNGILASFLGLLLWYVVLMVSSQGTDKSGVCPKERRYFAERKSSSIFCNDDGGCTGEKKCCPDNGSKVCKMPDAERNGTCPNPSEIPKSKDDFCTSDSECAAGAKCCQTELGNTCWPLVGTKEGVCKKPNRQCLMEGRPFCNSDTGCSSVEKCCYYNCSMVCMPPEKSS